MIRSYSSSAGVIIDPQIDARPSPSDSNVARFIPSIVHKINQQLTTIVHYAESAQRTAGAHVDIAPAIAQQTAQVVESAYRLVDLARRVQRMLEMSEPKSTRSVLNEVIAGAIEATAPFAHRHGISISWAPPDETRVVFGDKCRLQDVLVDLLKNACEAERDMPHSRRRIALRVQRLSSERIEVLVEDLGPGIAPELLPRIFEPCYSSKLDGLGIGLAWSHQVIAQYDGRMTAMNNDHGGATFRLSLLACSDGAFDDNR